MTKRKKNLIDMPTTPKFTKEMLEGLRKDAEDNSFGWQQSLLRAFPAMADELERLWDLEKDSKKYEGLNHWKTHEEGCWQCNSELEQNARTCDKCGITYGEWFSTEYKKYEVPYSSWSSVHFEKNLPKCVNGVCGKCHKQARETV